MKRPNLPGAGGLKRYEKKAKEVNPLRATPEYRAFHAAMIDETPVCCKVDCFKASTDIHHIKRVAEYPELVYDSNNIICVCTSCHHQIESAVNRGVDVAIWGQLFEGLING